MNTSAEPISNQRFSHVLNTLIAYKLFLIVPAILGMFLAGAYVFLVRAETWSAKQSLIVRDDLLGQSFKPGRFESLESMKSAQETILEISRRPQVIRNTMERLGPESKGLFGMGSEDYPSEELIEQIQGAISFSAPNGAEFGKTEVIVLNTTSSSRERAGQFIEILLEEIIAKTNEVRMRRLQSMELELTQARDGAQVALNEATEKLREMDIELGSDISAMDSLNNPQSSDSTIKRDISQIGLERRRVESELNTALSLLEALQSTNEEQFVTSAEMIKYQPALSPLNNALVEAQKTMADTLGRYTNRHPSYISAKSAVNEIQQQIASERDTLIATLSLQVATRRTEVLKLESEAGKLDDRLINLSSKRADSLSLQAAVRKRIEILNNAQSDLAEIQGLASGAKDATLLTPVDEAQVSTRPDGLGKKAMLMAGALGGLMFGLGIVMLVAPPNDPDSTPAEASGQTASQSASQSAGRAAHAQASEKLRDIVAPVFSAVDRTAGSLKKTAGSFVQSKRMSESAKSETPKQDSVPTVSPAASVTPPTSIVNPPANAGRSAGAVESAFALPESPFEKLKSEISGGPAAAVTTESDIETPSETDSKDSEQDQKKLTEALAEKALAFQKARSAIAKQSAPSSGSVVDMVDQAFAVKPGDATANLGESNPTVHMSNLAEQINITKTRPLNVDHGVEKETPASEVLADLQRRPPSVRPVDLAKSGQENDAFVRTEESKEPKENQPYVNPFLKNDRASSTDSKKSAKISVSAKEQGPAGKTTSSKEINRVELSKSENKSVREILAQMEESIGNSKDEAIVPIPEQIRKLSDSISNFAKPIAEPKNNDEF
ncbi:MAG: hypothetical protein AB8B55_03535 [Mariniblastus sp.]